MSHPHHRVTPAAAAVTLALTALAAPPALAMPAPASPGPCSEVCSDGGYGPGPSRPAHRARAVYSRQEKSTIPASAPSKAAGTAAKDRPPSTPTISGPRSEVVSGGGYGSGSAAPIVVRVTSPSTGFDWGDAGIGAAGGIALSMIGLGGALGVSQNRARRTRRTRTTALPS